MGSIKLHESTFKLYSNDCLGLVKVSHDSNHMDESATYVKVALTTVWDDRAIILSQRKNIALINVITYTNCMVLIVKHWESW